MLTAHGSPLSTLPDFFFLGDSISQHLSTVQCLLSELLVFMDLLEKKNLCGYYYYHHH